MGRTLLVLLLTPRAKLIACVTSGIRHVVLRVCATLVLRVGFEPTTTRLPPLHIILNLKRVTIEFLDQSSP